MIYTQYDLFQSDLVRSEKGKEASRSYLEMLASTCGHIASFGPCELEESTGEPFPYARIGNFRRKELHIRVISDAEGCEGYVTWKNKKVFYWNGETRDELIGETSPEEDMNEDWIHGNWKDEDFETKCYFSVRTYIPGNWENLIYELYDESMSGSLTSD